MKPTCCHFTSAHPPFDARIFLKELTSLAQAGYPVRLVACHDRDEVRNGVSIVAIPRRGGRFSRMTLTVVAVFREVIRSKAAICHFHDPELIPVGLALKLLGRKVIYDVHEDLPRQILDKHWLSPVVRRPIAFAAECIEWLAGCVFDRIVTATPAIARRFPRRKTVVVKNYALENELVSPANINYTNRRPIVVYVGGVTTQRGGLQMVEAIGKVRADLAAELHIAGNITPEQLAASLSSLSGWKRTMMLGYIDRNAVRDLLGKARVGLVVLHPTDQYRPSLPIKIFEYMSAGIPVIASNFPLWREIVERNGAGLLVDPMDTDAIARAIEWILLNPQEAEAMGQRGQRAVVTQFSWGSEEKKLLNIYRELL